MSFNRSTNVSNLKPDFDEQLWIIHIRTTIENEAETEIEVPVSIFNVPRILMATNPDSYTPQKVAIGPYHHWSPDLYEMERYKLAAAKRVQKQLQNAKFQCLVDQLAGLEARIQACYHKNLDLRNETLAWMMALDGSFLLEFLQIYAVKEGRTVMRASSIMSHLVDYAGRKSAHNIILRDMVMLENQIPLFVLRKILEIQLSSLELADEMLQAMLSGFSKELSPFRMMSLEARKISISQCAHLLDYLYQTIVPRVVGQQPQSEITESGDQSEGVQQQSTASAYSSYAKALFTQIWNMISKVNIRGPLGILKKLIISKPVKLVLKLPWKILSSLPGFSVLKRPVQYFMSTEDKKETEPENENEANKPPLVEEIAIPCVKELSESGVRFVPTSGDITSISFDLKTATFNLPVISLDVNSEVVLRNLVAYEASIASGPMVFTRYTELICGIIDTDEDVELLREKCILTNRLKSDREAADLWNGMNKSIKLTKVAWLDKAIGDVSKYYNGRWKVKIGKFMKSYVFRSWQILTLLGAILMLLLTALQTFCSVYSCARFFTISTDQSFLTPE